MEGRGRLGLGEEKVGEKAPGAVAPLCFHYFESFDGVGSRRRDVSN